MKIAVSYENGEIFQHFGKAAEFKVYEVENGAVVSSEVVTVEGPAHSHEARVDLLMEAGVRVVLAGGLGEAAVAGLEASGIEVISGLEGSADAAVEDYLAGKLLTQGASCAHCGGDEGCGSDDEEGCGGCGGGCGSCGGGCGEPEILFEGPNAGKKVKAHYQGTLDDGTQFDASYDRGEPLEFIAGVGMMIAGFDKAVVNMKVGEIVNVHLAPEEAYGMPNPDAIFRINLEDMPGSEELNVGQQVYLANQYGQPFKVKVVEKDDKTIVFDANHDLAGQALNFKIELVSVED